jgi:glycosyltransferase involved in cell wall biosynthesis
MKHYSSIEIKNFIGRQVFDANVIADRNNSCPKISIVTPSFNQGSFLERAILSVLNQNYPNLEYIIIDGGSTDSSVDVIKKYEKHLAYWVSEPDKGQSDAFNKGFAKATGEIFYYLASDDILLPGVLHKVAELFGERKFDVLYGNKLIIDSEDNVISERRCVSYLPGITRWGVLSKAGFAFYPDSCFYTRNMFEKVGGFDIDLHNTMDTDIEFKFLREAGNIMFLREYIIAFRVAPLSKTVSMGNSRGEKEREYLYAKYMPNPALKYLKFPLFIIYILMFIFQGDFDYILFRVLKEKRKKYHEYV